MITDLNRVDQIIDKYRGKQGVLIPALLDVQRECGDWLPKEVLVQVSKGLEIPLSQVLRVSTFYTVFNLTPRGGHLITVCLGMACHAQQSLALLKRVEEVLGIKAGETTPDLRFTLRTVNCLGCCPLGPTVAVDEEHFGKLAPTKVDEFLARYD